MNPIHTVVWRRLDRPGHEVSRLRQDAHGWELGGMAVGGGGYPYSLEYAVSCDEGWRTTAVLVRGWIGDADVLVRVHVDPEGRWHLNDAHVPAVDGSIDIDLAFSPSTNLLPIRRLSMQVGDEAEVTAAWLQMPVLRLEPLHQRYRRDREGLYRYEADGGRFLRNLEVDDLGFVIEYPGLWIRDTWSADET